MAVRIIIADDQRHARSGLRALLRAALPSPEIWEAVNGTEAVRLAGEIVPDAVLLDVRMPGMDGLEAARCIRQALPRTRIIVLSLNERYADAALAAGADAFVGKGEDPGRLIGLLALPGDRS
jgi:DNA-binding NarL/FixJ family response regulator